MILLNADVGQTAGMWASQTAGDSESTLPSETVIANMKTNGLIKPVLD